MASSHWAMSSDDHERRADFLGEQPSSADLAAMPPALAAALAKKSGGEDQNNPVPQKDGSDNHPQKDGSNNSPKKNFQAGKPQLKGGTVTVNINGGSGGS
jgi:hypothetical protein